MVLRVPMSRVINSLCDLVSAASDSGSTHTRLSLKAKQALQQAQMAYTSSLNEMMPVGKAYPGITGMEACIEHFHL